MSYIFDITVTASLQDSDLVGRILNFKEDLHRECFRANYLSVSDANAVDSALMPVSFSVSSKSGLAKFSKLIKKSLANHRVEHVVKVQRR